MTDADRRDSPILRCAEVDGMFETPGPAGFALLAHNDFTTTKDGSDVVIPSDIARFTYSASDFEAFGVSCAEVRFNTHRQLVNVRMASAGYAQMFYLDAEHDSLTIGGASTSARFNVLVTGTDIGGWFSSVEGYAIVAATTAGTAMSATSQGGGWCMSAHGVNDSGAYRGVRSDATGTTKLVEYRIEDAADTGDVLTVYGAGTGRFLNVQHEDTGAKTMWALDNDGSMYWRMLVGAHPASTPDAGYLSLYVRSGSGDTPFAGDGVYMKHADGYVTQLCTQLPYGATRTKARTYAAVSACVGATISGFLTIPAGALSVAVMLRVTTAFTGCTSFNIGTVDNPTQWGTNVAIALGTTTDGKNFAVGSLPNFPVDTTVVITANGGDATDGAFHMVASFELVTGPAE
jgi:hypothetical protein